MQITNHSANTIALPGGPEIRPGASAEVSDADWKAAAGHPVVKAWIATKAISTKADDKAAAPKGAAKPGADPLA